MMMKFFQALHVHVTDATYKLLERKTYDVQERPKMTINGSVSIATYFILNKKDRTGKSQPRPFHAVLEQMKKQETEEAKLKQSSSLKGGNILTPPPPMTPVATSPPPPKENGYGEHIPPPPASVSAPQNTDYSSSTPTPIEIPVPMKTIRHDESSSGFNQNSTMRAKMSNEHPMHPGDAMSDPYDPNKAYERQLQLQRSRACTLL